MFSDCKAQFTIIIKLIDDENRHLFKFVMKFSCPCYYQIILSPHIIIKLSMLLVRPLFLLFICTVINRIFQDVYWSLNMPIFTCKRTKKVISRMFLHLLQASIKHLELKTLYKRPFKVWRWINTKRVTCLSKTKQN